MLTTSIVGRDHELAALRELAPGRPVLLTGEPGIGKTTLWEAGVGAARERGRRALVARPTAAEARLPFAALIDLCDGIADAALAPLPAPQRGALEVALLRAEPRAAAPEPFAIALGLLNALRALAADEPLLIAVDDVPWLDAASAEALAFAARRLDGEPIAFLLARRPGRPTGLERALEPALQRVAVGRLSLGATRRLLAERLGLSLPRPLLRRIVEWTLGNPLFALEVGRTLREDGIPAAGDELPLPDALDELLGARVARLDTPQRRLLLALALREEPSVHELAAIAGPAAVEDGLEAGLLELDGRRVRASHPLLAAAARKRARPRERRELHRALARAVEDPQLRALHLALATDRPDAALAAAVDAAAADAAARGARHRAVQLAERALRLTPPDAPERHDRLLTLAAHLEGAGELQRLTDLLEPAIDTLPTGPLRARGWLLLGEGAGPRTIADLDRHLDRALTEPGVSGDVLAYVLAKKAALAAASRVDRIRDAEAWAQRALSVGGAGREGERLALYALAWARALSGRAVEDLCRQSDASAYLAIAPERIAGQRLVWRGEIAQARALLERLLAQADERGEPASYALLRLHLCELELRVGDWPAAARRLDEWEQSAEGDLLIRPMYQRCRALLAAGRGRLEEAERWSREAIARAEATGSRWDWLEARRAAGVTALLARAPARAAEHLAAAWEHTERAGVGDPGAFPVAPELVEALVDAGEPGAARRVVDRLRTLAERHEHPWGLAGARRARALTADPVDADALAAAADEYGRLGLRFDRARTLLAAGRAQRRLKQWGAARESLEGAAAAFGELGSDGWAELARGELARVGGRRPRESGELTPTERDVVELASTGLANKEIARSLHLAVHTVEVHLSRAYAKLGVRSRTQLAARLAKQA
ncbi:MAG TPA: AAA family ATPase [Solirubrobacteraceae bacterium]